MTARHEPPRHANRRKSSRTSPERESGSLQTMVSANCSMAPEAACDGRRRRTFRPVPAILKQKGSVRHTNRGKGLQHLLAHLLRACCWIAGQQSFHASAVKDQFRRCPDRLHVGASFVGDNADTAPTTWSTGARPAATYRCRSPTASSWWNVRFAVGRTAPGGLEKEWNTNAETWDALHCTSIYNGM
jgi:hypothetical protein